MPRRRDGDAVAPFLIAGLIGFLVQVAAIALLVSFTSMHYLIATIVAVEVAILINFAWHERWTWRDRPAMNERERWVRLARFNAMTGLTSIAGSVIVAVVLVELLSLSPIAANIISVIALGGLNFAGANTLVFRAGVAAAMLSIASVSFASDEAKLQPKTAQGFAKYVAAVEARRAKEIANHEPFLEFSATRLPNRRGSWRR